MTSLAPNRITPTALSRALDLNDHHFAGPLIVFVSGAAGSGKSTLCRELGAQLGDDRVAVTEFDRELAIPRWTERVSLFKTEQNTLPEANTLALREALQAWCTLLLERYSHQRIVVADVNADFLEISQAAQQGGVVHFANVLVQPPEQIRCARLSADPDRQRDRESGVLSAQLESGWSEYLTAQALQLNLPHIRTVEKARALSELTGVLLAAYLQHNQLGWLPSGTAHISSPKTFHHGFEVAAVSAGIPLNMVQKWLGHAQLTTTAIYADAVGEEEKKIAERMWWLFKSDNKLVNS